jgi:hypothetical protein
MRNLYGSAGAVHVRVLIVWSIAGKPTSNAQQRANPL